MAAASESSQQNEKPIITPASRAEKQSLLDAFVERANAAAAQVSVVNGTEEVARLVASGEVPTTTGNYATTRQLNSTYPALRDSLHLAGIELRVVEDLQEGSEGPSSIAARFAGDIGLILGTAGIAETGSFLSAEETLPARLLGMLSDTVYVLLPASSILATLDEMGGILSRMSSEGRRYMSLITGPSRTADIERVLTIGVQGPKMLHVVILSEE